LSTVFDSVGSPDSFGGGPVEAALVELLRAGSELGVVWDDGIEMDWDDGVELDWDWDF
jgi:hypothetical protein